MAEEEMMVEVAYATPEEQLILPVAVDPESSIKQVVEQSGIVAHFPEIDTSNMKVGVFGKLAKVDGKLNPGDRVEIYRPLIADPKEARKKRAAEGKSMKKGARA